MDMSAAALPPIHGVILPADRLHPRFAEYMAYRSGCTNLMVEASSFRNWLSCKEGEEYRDRWAEHPEFPAFQRWMRDNRGGGRPTKLGRLAFPENFKLWLKGERW